MLKISSEDDERKSIRVTKVTLERDKNVERKSICHAIGYNAHKNLLIIARPFRYSMKFFPMTGENFSELRELKL